MKKIEKLTPTDIKKNNSYASQQSELNTIEEVSMLNVDHMIGGLNAGYFELGVGYGDIHRPDGLLKDTESDSDIEDKNNEVDHGDQNHDAVVENLCYNLINNMAGGGLEKLIRLDNAKKDLEVKIFKDLLTSKKILASRYKRDRRVLLGLIQRFHSHKFILNEFYDFYKFVTENKIEYIRYFYFADTRGRIYPSSPCSTHSNTLYRYIFYLGKYNNDEVYLPIIPNYLDDVIQYLKLKGITNLHTLVMFFGIGAVLKNKLIKEDGSIIFKDIYYLGIDMYFKYKENFDFSDLHLLNMDDLKDLLCINYYIKVINLVLAGCNKQYFILKDSTASFAQHPVAMLGCTKKALQLLNLNNTGIMYDTYSVIINSLREEIKKKYLLLNKDTTFLKYIKRKYYKSIIMTIPYGIGKKNAKKNFLEMLFNNKKKIFQPLSEIEERKYYNATVDAFSDIFDILKDGEFWLEFYLKKPSDVINDLISLDKIQLDDMAFYPKYGYAINTQIEEIIPKNSILKKHFLRTNKLKAKFIDGDGGLNGGSHSGNYTRFTLGFLRKMTEEDFKKLEGLNFRFEQNKELIKNSKTAYSDEYKSLKKSFKENKSKLGL